MKTIVAGGREFSNYGLLRKTLLGLDITEVVCGMARGADTLGRRFADNNGIIVQKFPADWDTHGKRAGYIRNEAMADYADRLVAFWDGHSRGTKHMINLAKKKGLQVIVVQYDLPEVEEPQIWNRHNGNAPAGAVYIGRGTPWGNPFKIETGVNRDMVCDSFEEYVQSKPDLIAKIKKELKGKHLLCSCAPKRCHGETLLRIANESNNIRFRD